MHRQFLTWGTNGEAGLCGVYPQPIMDKTAYKYQMLYPVAQTKKINGNAVSHSAERQVYGVPGNHGR